MKRESFEERHGDKISVLKLVLIVVCLIAIPVSYLRTHEAVRTVNNRVTKVESPCLRYGHDSKICERAFEEAAASINHRMACYFQHRAGVFPPSCRGVHLRVNPPSSTKRGDASQTPSTAHQQPGPPSHGGLSGGTKGTHHAQSAPPPSEPAPTATAPVTPAPAPSPGNSDTTPGADNSVKACVEAVASACVQAETPELPIHP